VKSGLLVATFVVGRGRGSLPIDHHDVSVIPLADERERLL